MTHTLPFGLPWGNGSIGYFARGPAERLIVFIHGFGGYATKTWLGMEALLEDPSTASSDIVFYGYGSLAAPAQNSATLFRNFLDAAAGSSPAWQSATFRAGAPNGRNYRDVLIVAHSLGAVVTRRALLDAISVGAAWVPSTRILLFGPAHMGTRLVELKKELRSGWGALVADLFTFGQTRVPVLDDLAEGSAFLQLLLTESQAAVANGVDRPIRAERVIFGEKDYVVRTSPAFCSDPLADVWPDEDHCSVCRIEDTVRAVVAQL